MQQLRWPFQLFILSILVLSIYYPTLNAEVSLVDDKDAITAIDTAETLSMQDIFLPRIKNGGYYRPLIGVAYYLDKSLWGMNIRAMHLDNIFMHLVNVILVYFLTLAACRDTPEVAFSGLLPIISAGLFAVHPIATESVNWISGRTDPMAANFVLSAALLLIVYRKSRNPLHLAGCVVLILLGILAKEASLGMVIASGFILSARNITPLCAAQIAPAVLSWSYQIRLFIAVYALAVMEVLYLGNYWVVLAAACGYGVLSSRLWQTVHTGKIFIFRLVGGVVASSGLVLLLYSALRKMAFQSDVSKIGHTLTLMFEDPNYTISLFLGASGFYLKKFLLPLPLNFFILEIDPLYDLLGIAVLLFCLFLVARLNLAAALFIAGVCMFIPALPFAFGTIAWTGYAERYIYISSAFWIVSLALYLNTLVFKYNQLSKVYLVVVPTVLLFCGWQTFARNIVWQKNVTLLADTVSKSPKQPTIREMYMQALVNAGSYAQAKEQYAIGKSRSIFFSEGPDLIMAGILNQEGKLTEALKLSEKAVEKSNYTSERALKATIDLLERMIAGDSAAELLIEKKKQYVSQLISVSKDPMLFYNLGQKALILGDRHSAQSFLERAHDSFSAGSPYKDYSLRLLAKLKNDTK